MELQARDHENNTSLSWEIARSIVELVPDRRDLMSLSLTSRILNQEAESALYHAPFPCSKAQSIALLDLMAGNPRVASHVKTLVVDLTEDCGEYDSGSPLGEHTRCNGSAAHGHRDFNHCMRALSNALENMPRLRALCIFPDATHDATASAWPLRHCRSSLRVLRCGFSWDEDLLNFLATQPGIVDLCLERNLELTQSIPDSLLPSLSKFEGMPNTAAIFCQGRPVTHVSIWLDHDTNLVSLIPILAQSTKPVFSIELGDYNVVSLADIVLADIHFHFPRLRFLGPCVITPWQEETCTSDIALFKNLHTFILLDTERQARSPEVPGEPAQRTFVERLHAACPSLRRIAFAYSVGEPWSCLWVKDNGGWACRENVPLRFIWKDI